MIDIDRNSKSKNLKKIKWHWFYNRRKHQCKVNTECPCKQDLEIEDKRYNINFLAIKKDSSIEHIKMKATLIRMFKIIFCSMVLKHQLEHVKQHKIQRR